MKAPCVIATLNYKDPKQRVREWVQEYNPHSSEKIRNEKDARRWLKKKIRGESAYSGAYKRMVVWIELKWPTLT